MSGTPVCVACYVTGLACRGFEQHQGRKVSHGSSCCHILPRSKVCNLFCPADLHPFCPVKTRSVRTCCRNLSGPAAASPAEENLLVNGRTVVQTELPPKKTKTTNKCDEQHTKINKCNKQRAQQKLYSSNLSRLNRNKTPTISSATVVNSAESCENLPILAPPRLVQTNLDWNKLE